MHAEGVERLRAGSLGWTTKVLNQQLIRDLAGLNFGTPWRAPAFRSAARKTRRMRRAAETFRTVLELVCRFPAVPTTTCSGSPARSRDDVIEPKVPAP